MKRIDFPGSSVVPRNSVPTPPERVSRVPYEKIALLDSKKYRRARLEVPDISFTRVYRASNPPLCVVVVVGGLRGSNITVTPMSQPPQSRPTMMASPERDGVSLWRIEEEQYHRHTNGTTPSIHGFAGTNVSPYEKMASPERDKMASPEWGHDCVPSELIPIIDPPGIHHSVYRKSCVFDKTRAIQIC